ncbi:hypothetical protein L1049_002201 [Liquidambar formosana]|uniref:WRKY domain-containing protein n=1 Tax=Liquidambar formosana TaxID=63359 RepID=A0AAP0NGP4_LIQFO
MSTMGHPQNPNPNFTYSYSTEDFATTELQLSDLLLLDDGFGEEESSTSQSMKRSESVNDDGSVELAGSAPSLSNMKCKNGVKKNKMDEGSRVAFRTKSELEIMDDGFKWRKYGKKSVKNSPNPRNYYRCSSGGCTVKKRVERDRDDSSYVITTYDGVHNHESPSVIYYNQMPLMVPKACTLQASSHSFSS